MAVPFADWSLRRKLILLVLVISVPLVLLVAYQVGHFTRDLASEAARDTYTTSKDIASNVETFMNGLVAQGKAVAGAISNTAVTPEEANAYLKGLKSDLPLQEVALFGTAGNVVATSETTSGISDASQDPSFRQATSGSAATGGLRTIKGRPGFLVCVPVVQKGQTVGVVVEAVDAQALGTVSPNPESSGLVIVTDAVGRLVYSNAPRLMSLPESSRSMLSMQTVVGAVARRPSTSRSTVIPGLAEPYLGAQVPVPAIDWTAGTYLAASEVYGHVAEEILLTAAAILGVVFASLLLSRIYGTRAILRPIAAMAASAGRIGRGDFEAPIRVRSRDEVGALAESLAHMRDSLKRTFEDVTTLNEAAGQLNSTLEPDDVARTALHEIARILRSQTAVLTMQRPDRSYVVPLGLDQASAEEFVRRVDEWLKMMPPIGTRPVVSRAAPVVAQHTPPGEDRFLIVLPLVAHGEHVGRIDAVVSPRPDEPELERAEVGLAGSFAQQVATALQNARLYDEQRNIADVLQESLLTRPHHIQGLDIGIVYLPATEGGRLGGDFYDFVPVGQDVTAVIVGDISGKGLDAAKFTAMAKGAIRSFALDDPRPERVLRRASRVLAEQIGSENFVTAAYLLLDTRSGVVRYTLAGHPPPLLWSTADGKMYRLSAGGPPLGVEPDGYRTSDFRMRPGDVLLVYTDGLSEARRGTELFGETRVARAFMDSNPLSPREMAEAIAGRAFEFTSGRLTDDVAVLTIRFVPERFAGSAASRERAERGS